MKTIIFDLDDTIYSYKDCNYAAEKALYRKISQDCLITEDEAAQYLKFAKRGVKDLVGGTAAEHNRFLYMQYICELLKISPFRYAYNWYRIYWDIFLNVCYPYEYVIPTFEYLAKKEIKIGILTDLTVYIQFKKIKKLQIEKYIDYIVTSEEVGCEKPHEKMFLKALEKAHCAPSEAFMLGDSLEKDILGAKACGIEGILYKNGVNVLDLLKKMGC